MVTVWKETPKETRKNTEGSNKASSNQVNFHMKKITNTGSYNIRREKPKKGDLITVYGVIRRLEKQDRKDINLRH